MACADVVGVLLAAGEGSRFGGNKLEAMLGGTMLGLHVARTLAAMGCGHLVAVHDPAHGRFADGLHAAGYVLIDNATPEAGLSYSLALAAKAALATDAVQLLVCLADMPFIPAAHLQAVLDAGGERVVASVSDGTPMPPALFPRAMWPALATLTGESGARHMLCDAILVDGGINMLADIDTRADLDRWI